MPEPTPKPDRRKTPRRRLTRQEAYVRERRIMGALVAGVSLPEIAQLQGLSLRRVQQVTRTIIARRRDAMPEHYVDLQTTRLNEALIVAYSAMGGGNMKAVDRVVKIVRELDRYYGFTAVAPAPRGVAKKADAKQIASQVPERIESREMTLPLALLPPDALPVDPIAAPADAASP